MTFTASRTSTIKITGRTVFAPFFKVIPAPKYWPTIENTVAIKPMGAITLPAIADVINAKFPLFCLGSTPVKSSPLLETVGINVTVMMGEVQIRPGDVIVGDDTGVVVIPAVHAPRVLEVASRIKKVEDRMTELVLEGRDYKECRKLAEAEFPEV